ncbi:MAG: helix-turn-helix domain-containing protein, partial [Acidobacteriota bacterium]|nr:helix-turn-helix domain-containing protein [Acidobacteriota bacterium]
MTRLTLVPVHDVTSSQPAAFHELAAAKYLGMSRTTFRSVVRAGLIPYAEHVGGKARIYLRSGLDAY